MITKFMKIISILPKVEANNNVKSKSFLKVNRDKLTVQLIIR